MSCQLSVLHEIWDSFFYRPDSDSWIHGFMDSWIHGFMDSWIHGFMDSWIHGFMEGTKLPVPTVLHFFVLLSHFVHAFSYRYRSTHSSGVLQDSHLHRPHRCARVFFALPTCQHTGDPAILHHCRHVQRPTFCI
jgi:hypothetical protein